MGNKQDRDLRWSETNKKLYRYDADRLEDIEKNHNSLKAETENLKVDKANKISVIPDDFKLVTDSDDTNCINRAITRAYEYEIYTVQLERPYVTSSPILLREKVSLFGAQVTGQNRNNPISITNQSSNMFYTEKALTNVNIVGIRFWGNGTSKNTNFFASNAGKKWNFSYIKHCSFMSFDNVFERLHGQGLRLMNFDIAGVRNVGTIELYDSTLDEWIVGTDNNLAPRPGAVMTMIGCSGDMIKNIYFTASTELNKGAYRILDVKYNNDNLFFSNCWFDYSDKEAVWFQGGWSTSAGESLVSENIVMQNCMFRNNCRVEGGVDVCSILISGGKNIYINGNSFAKPHIDVTEPNYRRLVGFTTFNDGDGNPVLSDSVYVHNSIVTAKMVGIVNNQEYCTNFNATKYGEAAVTYTPGEIAIGESKNTTITLTGAKLGDFVNVSFSLDLQGVSVSSYISNTNTVTVIFTNNTDVNVTLAEGTLKAKLI